MGDLGFQAVAILVAAAFVAGFVDAIAGGGGLITIPTMLLVGIDPLNAVATNKLQSTFGSGSATLAFARGGHLVWRDLRMIVLASGCGALIGALALSHVPVGWLADLLPFLLIAIAVYFACSPRVGEGTSRQRMTTPMFIGCIVPLIGAYDGFFGPGTGSFFMLAFVSLLGFGMIRATAHTKAANFASNISGLAILAGSGHILPWIGLAMGAAQFCGSALGARAAMLAGARLVRPLLIVVCLALSVRLLADRVPDWLNLLRITDKSLAVSVDVSRSSRL